MPQSAPWEKYQPQSEAPPPGPWSNYASSEPSSTGTPSTITIGTPLAAPQNAGVIRAPQSPALDPNWKPPAAPPPKPKTFDEFLNKNLANSLDTLLTGLIRPVTHPVETTLGLSNLFMGMSEKSGFAPVMGQSHEAAVDAITNLYKQRYGSWEGFQNALYEDPFAVGSDVVAVLSTAGMAKTAIADVLQAAGMTETATKALLMARGGAGGTLKAIPGAALRTGGGYLLDKVIPAVVPGAPRLGTLLGGGRGLVRLGQGFKRGATAAAEAYEAKLAEEAAAIERARAAERFAVDRPPPERIGVFRRDADGGAATPESPVTPPATSAPGAPAVTMEELAPALTGGKSLSKLNQAERAHVQAVYDRIQHPLPVEQPTAAEKQIITPASEATATLEYNAAPRAAETARTDAQISKELDQSWKTYHDLRDRADANPTPETEAAAEQARERVHELFTEYHGRGPTPTTETAAPPRGKTAAELLQEEIAAQRAAAAELTPQQTPAEAQAAFEQAKATRTMPVEPGEAPAQAKADFEARQRPKAEEALAAPPAAAAAPPAPENLSEFMQGELPEIEQPGRSMYTETGELKSARQRGQEIKLRNIEAKAQRFSKALTAFGMDPADVAKVKEGWVTAEAMKAGSPPGWENVMHDLIAKGLLDKAEKRAPGESVPRIVELMQQKQIAKPATAPAPQNLSELMKPPALRKRPARKPRRTPPER